MIQNLKQNIQKNCGFQNSLLESGAKKFSKEDFGEQANCQLKGNLWKSFEDSSTPLSCQSQQGPVGAGKSQPDLARASQSQPRKKFGPEVPKAYKSDFPESPPQSLFLRASSQSLLPRASPELPGQTPHFFLRWSLKNCKKMKK